MTDTNGEFQFMAPTTAATLRRNGRVMMERTVDGDTGAVRGVDLVANALPVCDARALTGPDIPTCERNGFELAAAPVQGVINFLAHDAVVGAYYPQCVALVEQATGGRVFAFDHNIRSASGQQEGQRVAGGQNVQGPAHVVHGDYTLTSAPERLGQLAEPPGVNDTLRGLLPEGASLVPPALAAEALAGERRFAIINVWRSFCDEPVQRHPMAFCDAQTVYPEDLVVFEIHYVDRVGENYFAKHNPRQRFFYYPAMTRDEALLIKQWDSHGALAQSEGASPDAAVPGAPCTFSFHSAFHPPETADDAPDRWSIEVRCLVVYN